jgi:tetratricopeptide (TPR) repeat protein
MILLATLFLAIQVGPKLSPEVEARVEATRRAIGDEKKALDQRASLALEEASTLDREAQASLDIAARREFSGLAVRLLDEFNASHPKHELATPLSLQAAVYVWADGRRDLDGWRLSPGDRALKARAIESFDNAVKRLDTLEPELSGADPLVAQNARFRLAQALADLAWLETQAKGRDRLKRALTALDPIPTEEAVAGFARLLRGEVLGRLGEVDKAEEELEAAAKMKSPAPAGAIAEAKINVLRDRGRFTDALRAIEASDLDPIARACLAVSVRLAERIGGRSIQDRDDAEADALARARSLRGSTRIEARLAMNDLARTIERPSRWAEPEDWDVLAEGALSLGDPGRASRLAEGGADRARSLGRPEETARLRYLAAAILFQANDYSGADVLLGRIVSDPKAGSFRARAGMLRALARGRALAAKDVGASRERYAAALRDQVRDFGAESVTDEARWLLGRVEREDGRGDAAVALWKEIGRAHSRWLDARLAIADENQRTLDELRIGGDTASVRARFRESAAFLRESTRLASNVTETMELDLAAARLDVTPGQGRFELARSLADRLTRQAGTPEQHARARTLLIVGQAMSQKYQDAEKTVADESPRAPVEELLLAARLLDQAASESESEISRTRVGRLIRAITESLSTRTQGSSPEFQQALKLRSVRAALLLNDLDAARRELRRPPELDPRLLDPSMLRDLSDALIRLEAFGLAVDIERFRARTLKPGSPAWVESRYLLAFAFYRDGHPDRARSVLDAAAILHPDLGSTRLKDKIERLQQKLNADH